MQAEKAFGCALAEGAYNLLKKDRPISRPTARQQRMLDQVIRHCKDCPTCSMDMLSSYVFENFGADTGSMPFA